MDGCEEKIRALGEDELDRAVAERTREIKSLDNECRDDPPKNRSLEGHRQRTRERFLSSGLKGIAEHEILELLLFYTVARRDTKSIARELIARFKSVAGVFDADISRLTEVDYITESTAVLFKLIPQLVGVYYSETSKGVAFTNPHMLSQLFMPYFVGAAAEKFLLACFDPALCVISVTEISRGAEGNTSISLRELMQQALHKGCTMAAIAHNHPGSSPKPSDEDIKVTRQIAELLRTIDVHLMDHIIVGGSKTYSMRECGDLGIFD